MSITGNTLMADLADRGENPADNDPRFLLEINRDSNQAVLCFVEPLAFHAELARADEAKGYPAVHRWADLVDSTGYLTDAAAEVLRGEISRLFVSKGGISTAQVDLAEHLQHDDESSVGVEVTTTYQVNETYNSWVDRIGWPIVATLIDITDPGTFNCPYLFSALLHR